MKKAKRILMIVLASVVALMSLAAVACVSDDSSTTAEPTLTLTEKADVYLGSTLKLEAKLTGSDETIVWSSTNTDVATVENGIVTPVAEGTTNIFAKAAGLSKYCKVTVKNGDSLTVSPETMELVTGEIAGGTGKVSMPLEITATDKGQKVENPTLSYETSNDKVATAENGIVTATGVGKATITVKYEVNGKTLEKMIEVTVTKPTKEISAVENYIELGVDGDTVDFTIADGVTIPEGAKLYDKAEEDKREIAYVFEDGKVKLNKYSAEKIDGIDKYQLFSGERTLVFDDGKVEYNLTITVYTKVIMTAQQLRGTTDSKADPIERTKGIRFYSLHDRDTSRTAYLARAFVAGYNGATGNCSGGLGVEWWNAADQAAGIPIPEGVDPANRNKGTTEAAGDSAYIYKFGGYFVLGADLDMSVNGARGNMYDWAGYNANGNNWEVAVIDLDSNNTDVFGFHGIIDGKGHTISHFKVQKNNGSAFGINVGATGIVRNIAFDDVEMGQQQCGIVAFGCKGTVENITVNNCLISKADNTNAGRFDARGTIAGKPEGGKFRNIFIYNVYYKEGLTWGQYTGGIVGYGKGTYSDIYVIGTTKLCKDATAENPRATDGIDTVKGFDTVADYNAANIDFSNWNKDLWEIKDVTMGEGETAVTLKMPVLKVIEL